MRNALALIPARADSAGIPNKNFLSLADYSPVERAWCCALGAGFSPSQIVISTDAVAPNVNDDRAIESWLWRPSDLAKDDTPMVDVVTHALTAVPGPEDQIVLLLQPTQPLREPAHLHAAMERLATSGADSVVSVVEVPRIYSPDWQFEIRGDTVDIRPGQATRRQDLPVRYIRDGTVYAFRRSTLTKHGHIYGRTVVPLIINPMDTCPLDTPDDWREAERRLRERA